MNTVRRSSFRLRLALQTMLVAGSVVTLFGAGAWWYARGQQERNHEHRVAEAARRLWGQLTPRHRKADFEQATQMAFGQDKLVPAVSIIWHSDGNPGASITPPILNDEDLGHLTQYLPTGAAVVTDPIASDSPQRQARALSPQVGAVGRQRRPVMPEIRTPDFFTLKKGEADWRFGAFSNPHYTVFVGLSESDLVGEVRHSALGFAGAGAVALLLAGAGAWWASGRAMRPIDRIVSAANSMSAGNLDERIPVHGKDDYEFDQLIQSLNNMTCRLKDSFEQSSRFTADASHELKTPLAVMQSTLTEALRSASLDEETRRRIDLVLHQTSRLKHITHSLLVLSQADAGELPVRRERYNLSEDLNGLMEDAESLCEDAGLSFKKEIEPEVFVHADSALMHQVFQNLVSNSVKHNRQGGSASVRLTSGESDAVFEISNTVAEAAVEPERSVFDRFYRAEASRRSDGFGLGLNIAYELASANGAELELVPSARGKTTFAVRVPLKS